MLRGVPDQSGVQPGIHRVEKAGMQVKVCMARNTGHYLAHLTWCMQAWNPTLPGAGDLRRLNHHMLMTEILLIDNTNTGSERLPLPLEGVKLRLTGTSHGVLLRYFHRNLLTYPDTNMQLILTYRTTNTNH